MRNHHTITTRSAGPPLWSCRGGHYYPARDPVIRCRPIPSRPARLGSVVKPTNPVKPPNPADSGTAGSSAKSAEPAPAHHGAGRLVAAGRRRRGRPARVGRRRLHRQRDRVREPGRRRRTGGVGRHLRRRRLGASRASPPTSASTRAAGSTSRSSTIATSYRIDIYRMGYYDGNGARKMHDARTRRGARPRQPEDDCVTERGHRDLRLRHVAGVGVVARCRPTAVVRRLRREARPHRRRGRHEPHHLRRPRRLQHVRRCSSRPPTRPGRRTTTTAARTSTGAGRRAGPLKVSYNRPFATRNVGDGRDWLFSNEYPMIRFLERNGYDVSYTTDVDSDRRGNLITNHQDVPVGRPRRVLVGASSAPTSRPPATPA